MQKLYKNFLERLVLSLVFVCGLSLLAVSQTISITPAASPVCSGANAVYDITVTGGTGSFELDYNIGMGVQTFSIPDNNPIQLTIMAPMATVNLQPLELRDLGAVTSSDLSGDPVVTIVVQALPTAVFDLPAYEQCAGTSTDLGLTLTGTGTLTIGITDDLGNPEVFTPTYSAGSVVRNVSPTVNANYTITTVTDALGCIGATGSMTSVTIKNTLDVAITAAAQICGDATNVPVDYATTSGSAGPYDIYYSVGGVQTIVIGDADGILNTTIPSSTPYIPSLAINVDSVRYSSGLTCTQNNVDSKTILINEIPTATFGVMAYEQCEGTSTDLILTLTGTGNLTYQVQDNMAVVIDANTITATPNRAITVSPLVNTSYNVTQIVDDFGCLGTTGSTTAITIKDSLATSIVAAAQICGDAVNTPVTYNVTAGSAGNYDVFYHANGGIQSELALASTSFMKTYPTLNPPSANFHIDSIRYSAGLACTQLNTSDHTIIVNNIPTAMFAIGMYEQCEGTTTNLQLNLTGDGTLNYEVRDSLNVVVTTGSSTAGTVSIPVGPITHNSYYFVTSIVDGFGCVGPDSNMTSVILKDSITANILLTPQVCAGTTNIPIQYDITGSGAPYNVYYSVNAGDSVKAGVGASFVDTYTTIAGNTLFTVDSVEYSTGLQCKQYNLVSTPIAIIALPTVDLVQVVDTICNGSATTLNFNVTGDGTIFVRYKSSIGNTGTVSGSAGLLSAMVSPGTGDITYFVDSLWNVSGVASCTNTFVSDTTRLHVKQGPTVMLSPSSSNICQDDVVTFTAVVSGSLAAAAQGNFQFHYKLNGVDTIRPLPYGTSFFQHAFSTTTIIDLVSIADGSTPTCVTNIATQQLITVKPKATAVFNGNKTICEGASAALGIHFVGTGPYNYTINSNGYSSIGDTTINVSPTNDSVFTITQIVDGNGCIATTNIPVTVFVHKKPVVTFNTSADKVCKGTTVNLIDTITGGTPNFTLYFSGELTPFNPSGLSNGASTFSRIVNNTTTYTLDSIRDNSVPTNCYFPIGISRVVQAIDYPTATVGTTDNTVCFGTTVNLDFTVTGAGIDTVYYHGSDVATPRKAFGPMPTISAGIVPTISGNVTYFVDSIIEGSGAGCKSIGSSSVGIIVTPTPTATISGGKPVCESNTTPLELYLQTTGTGSITVDYADNQGNTYTYTTVAGNDTIVLGITQVSGPYIFTVTGVTSNVVGASCPGAAGSSTQFDITASPKGTVTSNNTNIVAGGTATLVFGVTGVGPFDLVYQEGSNPPVTLTNVTPGQTLDVTPVVTTTYTILNVIDKGTAPVPCESGVQGDITILVTNHDASISGDATICLGDSFPAYLSFKGNGPYTVTVGDGLGHFQSFSGKVDQDQIYITPQVNGTLHFTITNVLDEVANTNSTFTSGEAIVNVVPQKTVSVSGNTTICEGQSSTISFNLVGSGTFNITYTDGRGNDYSFNATAASSPVIRTITPTMLINGVNNFTIKSVTNSNPSSVCPIVASGSGTITVKATPAVTMSLTPNPVCTNSSTSLVFNFASAGPFDVVLVTDSGGPIKIDTLKNISSGFTRPIVATRNMTFTTTDVWYSTGNLCTNTTDQTIQLKVNTPPTATISGNSSICAGNSASLRFLLSGKLPITINYTDHILPYTLKVYNTIDTSISVSPSATLTYDITSVTDGNSPTCSSAGAGSAKVTVIPRPDVSLDLSQDSICAQQTSRLRFTCTGLPPFTIYYSENGVGGKTFIANSTGASELVVSPSVTTIYRLDSVVDGSGLGCSSTLSDKDTLTILPIPNATIFTQTPNVCEGTLVKIRLDFTGTGNISARIVNNSATYDTTVTGIAGTHFIYTTPAIGTHTYSILTVSDQSIYACTRSNAGAITIKVIPKPTATLTSTSEVCEGNDVVLEFDVVGSGLMTVNYANDQGGTGSFTTTTGHTSLSVNTFPATGTIKYFITSITTAGGVVCNGVSTDTATVKVSPNPVVTISSTQKTICRGDATQLKFSVSGNGPYKVYFRDGNNTHFVVPINADSDGDGQMDKYFTVSPSQTTTFRVDSVTDNSSPTCYNFSTVAYTINVNQKPTASISGNNVICEGDSVKLTIILTGKAPLSLTYTGDGSSHTLNGLSAGTLILDTVKPHAPGANYSIVSVSDANAPTCTSPGNGTASIIVNSRPQGTINAVPNPICNGGSAAVVFGITGGVPPYTIVYAKGGINDTITATSGSHVVNVAPSVTTTYQLLSITDASSTKCETKFTGVSTTLVVNSVPTATVDASPATVCQGDVVALTLKANGGSNITVSYNLNGVAQPAITLTTDHNADGFLDTTFNSTPTLPGSGIIANYAITSAQINGTGCTGGGGDSAYVQVNPTPTASLASITPSTICFGDSAQLKFNVTGAGTIKVVFAHIVGGIDVKHDEVSGLASASPLTFQAVPFTNTTYQIISVTSTANAVTCNGTIGGTTQSVTVNARPTINFSLSANPICAGNQTQVTFDFPVGVSPFDVEYVIATKGDTADTLVVNNIASGYTFSSGALNDTTTIYAYKITDNGTPACISKDSVGVKVNVNPLATAFIHGDSTFCVNQQEGFYVDLVGVGNITFQYRDQIGNVYPPVSLPAGTHFVPVNQPLGIRTYSLISINDQSIPSCIGTYNGTGRVNVIPAPSATFTGLSGICQGDTSTITIQLSGGGTDSITVYYHDQHNNHYTYRNKIGIYDVLHSPADSSIFTPDSVKYKSIGCPGVVSGTGEIDVRPNPTGTIDLVTDICKGQSATATFKMKYVGPFDLTYQIGSNPPVVVPGVDTSYVLTFNPTSSTTLKIRDLVYSDIPLCTSSNVATVNLRVNDSLKVVSSNKLCNNINTGFTLDLTIGQGKAGTYAVNGVPTTSPYTTPFIPNGVYSFVVSDSSGCPAVTIAGNDTCACISDAGTMANLSRLEACENQPIITFHNGDQVKDANDTLVFVLTDKQFGSIGVVYGVSPGPNPGFAFNANGMTFEQPYYIRPVVSDTNSVKGFSVNDRCISVGIGPEVVWHQSSKLEVEILKNDSNQICKDDLLRVKFKFTGNGNNGPHDVIFNPGFGVDVNLLGIVGSEYVWESTTPVVSSGNVKVKLFEDKSITTGCNIVSDFDSLTPYTVRPLPVTGYTISDAQICEGQTVNFNPANTSTTDTYEWHFGDSFTSTSRVVSHTYLTFGTRVTYLVVTNQFGCTDTSATQTIEVQPIPDATMQVSPGNGPYCYSSINKVTFTDLTNYAPAGSRKWLINNVLESTAQSFDKTFTQPGDYVVQLIYLSPFGCSDTAVQTIHVEGPVATLNVTAPIPCVDNDYVFELTGMNSEVNNIDWRFKTGSPITHADETKVTERFPRDFVYPSNSFIVTVTLRSDAGCTHTITQTVELNQINAAFTTVPTPGSPFDPNHCLGTEVAFTDASLTTAGDGVATTNWSFGANSGIPNSATSTVTDTFAVSGTFPVILNVTSTKGCTNADTLDVVVFPLPNLVANSFANCPGQTDTLRVSNIDPAGTLTVFDWGPMPNRDIVDTNRTGATTSEAIIRINTIAQDTVVNFVVLATDAFGCVNTITTPVAYHNLQKPNVPTIPLDTSYVVGYELQLDSLDNFNIDQEDPRYTYNWDPLIDISCGNCPEPTISTMEDRNYVLSVTDVYGCYNSTVRVNITIEQKESLDLPDAFTPNGDGINDVIIPDGHALEEVVEYKIFNRWGDLIHDASGKRSQVGWDGKVKGKLQTQDVYSYTVTVKTFTGKTLTKKGKFTLIR